MRRGLPRGRAAVAAAGTVEVLVGEARQGLEQVGTSPREAIQVPLQRVAERREPAVLVADVDCTGDGKPLCDQEAEGRMDQRKSKAKKCTFYSDTFTIFL